MLHSVPSHSMDSMQGYMPSFKVIGAVCGAAVISGMVGYVFGYNRYVNKSNCTAEEIRRKMVLEFEDTKMCSVNLLFSLYHSENNTDSHMILENGYTRSNLNFSLTRAGKNIQTLLASPENKEVCTNFRRLMMQTMRDAEK
jgi:hypothetical protein